MKEPKYKIEKPRHALFLDLEGHVYGSLTVKEYLGRLHGLTKWLCVCSCGNEVSVFGNNLRKGRTKACGHLKEKHGMSKNKIYMTWHDMKRRCRDPKHKNYRHYGGRGIQVCERWNKFSNFYKDMGAAPDGHFLERINNNDNYSPENCKWATISEQARNKRNNRLITYKGKTQCLAAWASEIGVSRGIITRCLDRGATLDSLFPSKEALIASL